MGILKSPCNITLGNQQIKEQKHTNQHRLFWTLNYQQDTFGNSFFSLFHFKAIERNHNLITSSMVQESDQFLSILAVLEQHFNPFMLPSSKTTQGIFFSFQSIANYNYLIFYMLPNGASSTGSAWGINLKPILQNFKLLMRSSQSSSNSLVPTWAKPWAVRKRSLFDALSTWTSTNNSWRSKEHRISHF